MRILALDVGDKTIGVAVSDPFGLTAQGLEVLRRGEESEDVQRVVELARRYGVEEVVIGLPRTLAGEIGPQAQKVLRFGELLAQQGLKIIYWDERFTTKEAEKVLLAADVSRRERRRIKDILAAVLLLEAYLERRRGEAEQPKF
ncbi:Holliday junction resolvase RuvX [Ammonifex thiophilus]|uniref:Putative pre-16S rRNA nuclease n=1 Tax=Ammonifex thiophilus TaxID=444093 RepID=A0A3D8P3K9_9THEO|nr:Holliday junction resolvase RuvX [Ammonifex thiophilus]RDV81760.1 Holliday junction resolvase RuvX [Ammonifex thiophilus]